MADKNQPTTDDQELAKVLADMSNQAKQQNPLDSAPQAQDTQQPAKDAGAPQATNLPEPEPEMVAPPPPPAAEDTQAATAVAEPATTQAPTPPAPALPGDLSSIKKAALDELRPIVDKLSLPAEEKFDALLLVIRSSDDQSLVKAAYDAAESITDEARKAQALLDIVKEIEYFSQQQGQAAV